MTESIASIPGAASAGESSCATLPDIPVYTERETRSDEWSRDPRLRTCSYYIIDQSAEGFHNSPGRPYGVGRVTQRAGSGLPYHFYLGRYYTTLEEALLVGQLAEYFARLGDSLTEECVLDGEYVYDLRARTAYRLLAAYPEIADPPSRMFRFGNTTRPAASFPFQPTPEELAEILQSGGDWRRAWVRKLPPDPLQLLRWMPDASFPEIDWVATIKRVAATVATRHPKPEGGAWSHSHSIRLLLDRFRIPIHWYLLDAALRRCVHESGGALAFGSRDERADQTLFRWRAQDPASFAASVPPCPCCGQPRDLYMGCGGLTYGRWEDEGHHRFMQCPFDGYGCQGGQLSFTCCSCSALHQLVMQDAPVSHIEAAIAERLHLLREQGGTPFLSALERAG